MLAFEPLSHQIPALSLLSDPPSPCGRVEIRERSERNFGEGVFAADE